MISVEPKLNTLTPLLREKKEALNWLRYLEMEMDSELKNSSHAIVLGLGKGLHILELQNKYPDLQLTIVEPRRKWINEFHPTSPHPLQYISQKEGLIKLKKRLEHSAQAIPILLYRPCWENEDPFFPWAHRALLGYEEWPQWQETRSHFILESLFA